MSMTMYYMGVIIIYTIFIVDVIIDIARSWVNVFAACPLREGFYIKIIGIPFFVSNSTSPVVPVKVLGTQSTGVNLIPSFTVI